MPTSEGEEGKFYVWTRAEIEEVLGEADAKVFADAYDVTDAGNWEGHTILNRLHNPAAGLRRRRDGAGADARQAAWRGATGRIRPGWDDKVLADWNGLMIAALAHAARVFDRPDWLDAAATAFRFVVERMETDGRLAHAYRAGQAKVQGTASDYANMIWGALGCYQATNDPAYPRRRRALVRHARQPLLGRRRRRLRLHRRRHVRRHRAHARRPRRRHAQRQRAS